MASGAPLTVMYGVMVWNPSGTGSTSPLMCPLSGLAQQNAWQVYAQTSRYHPPMQAIRRRLETFVVARLQATGFRDQALDARRRLGAERSAPAGRTDAPRPSGYRASRRN